MSIFDIDGIPNISSVSTKKYSALRDEVTGDPDGWKIFDANTQSEGHIGWMTVKKAKGRFKEGDVVPYGQYYTECVIDTRNKILNDSGINLPIPQKAGNVSEKTSLDNCLANVQELMGTAYRGLYYPAVSYCYAYCPATRTDLDDRFKEHNWWMPTFGEFIRAGYYYTQTRNPNNSTTPNPLNIFQNIINKGLMATWPQTYELTTTETDKNTVQGPIGYYSAFDTLQISGMAKNATGRTCKPICKF